MTSVNAELYHREYDPPECRDEWHRENHYTATDCPRCGEHWEPGPRRKAMTIYPQEAARPSIHELIAAYGEAEYAHGMAVGGSSLLDPNEARERSYKAREALRDELARLRTMLKMRAVP